MSIGKAAKRVATDSRAAGAKQAGGAGAGASGKKSLVFIFGGPGTMKGAIVEELVLQFGFVIITAADIVLQYLPSKVANTVSTTNEIQELLKNDQRVLSLEWILHLVTARMATDSHQRFLLDMVPNLQSILELETYNKEDYNAELAAFERRQPVMFALSLTIANNSLLRSSGPGIGSDSLSALRDEQAAADAADDADDKAADKEKKKEKKDQGKFEQGSDEADSGRMIRRYDQFASHAKPFLDYFEQSNRVVHVQVTTRRREHVVKRVMGFFKEVGFPPERDAIRVVLFVMNDGQITGLDPIYYKMLKVRLSTIVSSPNEPLDALVGAARRHIDRAAATSPNHLVILDVPINHGEEQKRRVVNFLEVRHCYLDHYIKIKSTAVDGEPFKKRFKSISTTIDEILVFPDEMTSESCQRIATAFDLAGGGDAVAPVPAPDGRLDSVAANSDSAGPNTSVDEASSADASPAATKAKRAEAAQQQAQAQAQAQRQPRVAHPHTPTSDSLDRTADVANGALQTGQAELRRVSALSEDVSISDSRATTAKSPAAVTIGTNATELAVN